jgi:hypothetical protein
MVSLSGGMFIVVTDAKPNRAKVVVRDERDRSGLCVKCGNHPGRDKDEKPKPRRLGCCRSCYDDYMTALESLRTEEARATFRAKAIRECWVMPDRQGQRLDKVNDFMTLAAEVKE